MGISSAWHLKSLGLIDNAAVSVNLRPGYSSYVKFGKQDRIGTVGDDFTLLDADEQFRVGAKDFTWGNTPLNFESTQMQVNLDSSFTFLPQKDFEKLLPILNAISGVVCESNLCYYPSNCSAIKLQSGFGFTAFSGNNSTPVEMSIGSHLLSG